MIIAVVVALLTTFCATTLYAPPPAPAGSPKERIAFMLTGPTCHKNRQAMEAALRQVDGVAAVDGGSVPGHLLLDVEKEKTSPRELLAVVHATVGTHLSCRAEIMQSCITSSVLNPISKPTR